MKINRTSFSEFFASKLDENANTKTPKKALNEAPKSFPRELASVPVTLRKSINQANLMIDSFAKMVADTISSKTKTKVTIRGDKLKFGWGNRGEIFVSSNLSFYVAHGTMLPDDIDNLIPNSIKKIMTFKIKDLDRNYVFDLEFKEEIGKIG